MAMDSKKIAKLKTDSRHASMRGWFGFTLHEQMRRNKDIYLLTADLGYKLFDNIAKDFPDRFINVGASEQAMLGIAVGLALEGKVPVCYSITPFLLYRPFEWIRNYLDHEKIPVILVGSGRDKDYGDDGFTHYSEEAVQVLSLFPNIRQYWPDEKEEVPDMIKEMIFERKPCFISLKRG